ncbi:hypothetical protein E4U42_003013 [Claviceps africana]|uniref:Tat pathway signal sequence n=1 Tax=Claviceps africana TaxID=83212 RepID=A0A8K0J8M9_9HYPO|nr:hypothetical protein E4U42_003013 [Claviceps africana]
MPSWGSTRLPDSEPDTPDEQQSKSHERDSFLGKDGPHDVDTRPRPPRRPRLLLVLAALTLLNLVLLLTSVVLVSWARHHRRVLARNERNSLLKLADAYSPVYDQVQVPLLDVTINGSLMDRGDSIYRQPPSAAVDAAWESIAEQLPHAISREDVIRLGKDPDRTAKWPPEWGFGPDAYIAELDIVHTVHCLNAIRRDVHWRHYFGRRYPDGRFPEMHRTHTDHCIYIVLQNLMCAANGDVVTNVWVEGQLHPFPDFSIHKRCRDHGALIDWHRRTQVTDVDRFLEMRMPPGHVPWKMSQAFHDLFGTGLKGGEGGEVLD